MQMMHSSLVHSDELKISESLKLKQEYVLEMDKGNLSL